MDSIRAQTKNPLTIGIIGFILGSIFGLVVLGWWVWPVEWTNATPEYLSTEWQEEYLRMTIEAFAYNGDTQTAIDRYTALGSSAQATLDYVNLNPEGLSTEVLQSFNTAVAGAAPPVTEPPKQPSNLVTVLLVLFCLLFLVVVGLLVYIFLFRGRFRRGTGEPTAAMQAEAAKRQVPFTEYAPTEQPVAQFMASYKIGDDLFDESFSIESPSGEFLGECGVGISDTIGVGDPKKVTGFEVWLFDKNDIQTVTKVVMSAHAFNDLATRQRLSAKGEPVLAQPGGETTLETQSLVISVRVAEMGYGDGALPPESFFDHLILELSVWGK